MKIRVGLARAIAWFDASSVAVDTGLLTGKLFSGNTEVQAVQWTRNSDVPNLFVTKPVTLTAAGQYQLRVYYNAVLTDTLTVDVDSYVSPLNVGVTPLCDLATATPTVLKVSAATLGANNLTVSLRVVDSAGTISASLPCAYTQATDTYNTSSPYTFASEGPFFFVWHKVVNNVVTPTYLQDLLALILVKKESTVLRFIDAAGASIVSATVVVSKPSGTQVVQGTTGTDGGVTFELLPATYVVSILKTGVVFSRNNFGLTVTNTTLVDWKNRQLIEAPTFSPTVSATPVSLSKCKLTATLYTMSGTPLPHADVQVGYVGYAQSLAAGVFDTRRVYQTDSNGYVEFELVQGITVEVVVTPLGLRRLIKVPAEAGPINLLTLLAAAEDVFNIAKPSVQTAPKRNL